MTIESPQPSPQPKDPLLSPEARKNLALTLGLVVAGSLLAIMGATVHDFVNGDNVDVSQINQSVTGNPDSGIAENK